MLPFLTFLALLGAANGTPVLLRLALGSRYARPLDGGLVLRDGKRLFGETKTIRGLAAALVATAGVAWIAGYAPLMGAGLAAAAMLGDLLSSFIKRRLGLKSSHDVHGLDQIPESLIPALLFRVPVGLTWGALIPLLLVFFTMDVILTRWLRRFEARRQTRSDPV